MIEQFGGNFYETGELELADTFKEYAEFSDVKESKKYQKRIASLIGKYMDFVNREDIQKKLLNIDENFGFGLERVEEIIEKKLAPLPERISDLVGKGVVLTKYNSLIDVLDNSPIALQILIENKFNKGLFDAGEVSKQNAELLKKFQGIFSLFLCYIDSLRGDDEKLIMELTKEEGYLNEFKKYFFLFPTGAKKLVYFKFFSELKQKEKDAVDIVAVEATLDNIKMGEQENFIDKDSLVKDIKDGKFFV